MTYPYSRSRMIAFLVLPVLLVSAPCLLLGSSAGISGRTLKPGGTPGCSCHGSQNTNTTFSVTGPATVAVGGTSAFSVSMNGSSGSNGGVDIAVNRGTLALNGSSVSLRVLNGEVVHSQAVSVPAQFQFNYTAPGTIGTDTLYITGKGGASNNSWNHAAKFVIQVLTLPVVPTLLSPTNGVAGISTRPTLSWNTSSGATTYRLQVSVSNTFGTTVFDDSTITLTSQQLSTTLNNGAVYYWRVRGKNAAGVSDWSQVWSFTTSLTGVAEGEGRPREFALSQNYPNPFNPSTTLNFDVPEEGNVSLIVFDLIGRQIAVLANGRFAAGSHTVLWNAAGVSSGLYLAQFKVSGMNGSSLYTAVRKLVLAK